jgi:hypothetical protein
MNMKSEYEALMEAAQALQSAKSELNKEDGVYVSPAWSFVNRAQKFVTQMAEEVFRQGAK